MTFALSKKSLGFMEGIHPDLKSIVLLAIMLSEQDFGVEQRQVRDLAYQRQLVNRGVSKTMKSNHLEVFDLTGRTKNLYGHAIDLVPWIDGAWKWDWAAAFRVAAAMSKAAKHLGLLDKLCWGGVWDMWMSQYADGHMDAATMSAAEKAYCVRHPGKDFVDGPHFQLYKRG